MENKSINRIEAGLIVFAVIAAIAIRFINLGGAPMGDVEAQRAMAALNLAQGKLSAYSVGENLYLVLTALLFSVFSASEFLARFIPAIAGTLVALSPFYFWKRLGRMPALIAVFLLAFDPALVSASRTAGGATLALLSVIALAAAWEKRNAIGVGVCVALGILSGEVFWFGLLTLIVGLLLTRTFSSKSGAKAETAPIGFSWKSALLSGGAALLAVGGGLLIGGQALSSVGYGILNFLGGWTKTAAIGALFPLLALILYAPILVIFGVWQGFRSSKAENPVLSWLFYSAFLALFLIILYPGRSMDLLVWVTCPLAILAAQLLADELVVKAHWRWPAAGLGIMLALLLTSFWLTVLRLDSFGWPDAFAFDGNSTPLWLWLPLSLFLGFVAIYNVHLAWPDNTRLAIYLAATILLSFSGVASAWSAAGLNDYPDNQIWRLDGWNSEEDLFEQTLADYSGWLTRVPTAADIVVQNSDTPSLRWVLRNYEHVAFTDVLPADATPEIVITPNQPTLNLAAEYRGQDFAWDVRPTWSLMLPQEWFRWMVFKKAPQDQQTVLVWVRVDAFPDRAQTNP
jgi:hypothetical protein